MTSEMVVSEKGPIFIGGLDRCGKTTLRAFLASHPRIAIPSVGSNMWTYFYGQYGDLADDDNFEQCLADMLNYKHVAFLKPDPERIRSEFRQGPRTYGRLFSLFLIHFAEREGKPRWGVQTGLIEQYADHVFAAYPDVKMLQMVRDPRDRYEASLALWPKGKMRAGGATARWLYSMRLAKSNLKRYEGHYMTVHYEAMVTEPEATLRRICEFLDEEYAPEMLTMEGAKRFRRKINQGVDPEPGQIPVKPDYIGCFRQAVPKPEIAFMQSIAGREMIARGYQLEPVRFTGKERLRYLFLDWPLNLARMVIWQSVELLHQWFPNFAGRKPGARMILDRQKAEISKASAR